MWGGAAQYAVLNQDGHVSAVKLTTTFLIVVSDNGDRRVGSLLAHTILNWCIAAVQADQCPLEAFVRQSQRVRKYAQKGGCCLFEVETELVGVRRKQSAPSYYIKQRSQDAHTHGVRHNGQKHKRKHARTNELTIFVLRQTVNSGRLDVFTWEQSKPLVALHQPLTSHGTNRSDHHGRPAGSLSDTL